MSSKLRVSTHWDCAGDELAPGTLAVLHFYNDQKELRRMFSIPELYNFYQGNFPMWWVDNYISLPMLKQAGMVKDEEEESFYILLQRGLAFLMKETRKQNFTRRSMLQVIDEQYVVVKKEENNWEFTRTLWREDL